LAHIKRIDISNWIGISELSVAPGKVNYISGKKGAGKTSFIEALEKLFTNKNRRAEVVRHGETEATLFAQLDDGLEVDRRVRTDKADYLKNRKPGQSVPQSEAFLRKLINGDIFRPLEFVKKSPEEQAKIILNMLEISWTMDDIKTWFGEIPTVNYEAHILQILKQIETLYYTNRETINREIKVLEAQVKGIKDELPANYDGEFWREQKVQEYYAKVAEAEENNRKIANARTLIDGLESRIAIIKAEAETEKQAKKNRFDQQRGEIREYKQFLVQKIEKANGIISQSGQKISESEKNLDLELQAEIEKLKAAYAEKKQVARRLIEDEAAEQGKIVSTCEASISAKDQELLSLDTMEVQALAAIDEKTTERINTENAKTGNAMAILKDTEEIDIAPLREKAEEVANMQSYLRDYDRMIDITKTKLAPRQEQSQTLTARIEKARELPMELLKIAAVPIPEINIDNEGRIRIGQTLLSGLSEGEQLELAYRMAKAQCGDLKVICLDGFNKINPADREWIEEEMQTDEYQYFVISTEDGDLQIETKEAIA
jgi:DNA repair exonuclease SbcCD ATPase subunit